MSSKFFTNQSSNTLFDKFKNIAQNIADFYNFHTVAGSFRSLRYLKLHEESENVEKNKF
jgi:hypothetical protein